MNRRACLVVMMVVAGIALAPSRATATTITLDATNRGWYASDGGSNPASPTANYVAGNIGGLDDIRDWFKFDLSALGGTVTAAVLLLDNTSISPNQSYFSTSDASETFTLFDIAPGNIAGLGSSSLAIYADLANGASYGSHVATNADNGTTVSIALNAAALTSLNLALGSNFALGGAITTLNGVSDAEYIFGYSDSLGFRSRLELSIDAPAATPVPEPSSALLLVTGIGAVARRRMRNA